MDMQGINAGRSSVIRNAAQNSVKVGNPIGRWAEVLDREAREVELQEMEAGMGTLRHSMLACERAAMYAEDKPRGHYQTCITRLPIFKAPPKKAPPSRPPPST